MGASKLNYIVYYDGFSQVYGAASKDVVLTSPLPPGRSIEDRHVVFVTYEPDTERLVVHPLPHEEIVNATLKEVEKKNAEKLAD